MTSVSHLPIRLLKGVTQRPSSLPHGSALDRLLLPVSANQSIHQPYPPICLVTGVVTSGTAGRTGLLKT